MDAQIAGAGDAGQVARVLAAGFSDDPVLCWLFEEPGRADKLDALFGFLAPESLVPRGATWLGSGSCAAWTPPLDPGWPDDRTARFVTALSAAALPADLERLDVLEDAVRAAHPTEAHWYLGFLATEPARRGEGRGGALLAASLAVVDADRLPAYLESTNPRNVSLYRRHGFEAVGSIDLPGGPSLVPMWRPAR